MKKTLVVLTGAGMSAESGIPTFRDAGGLWEGHRVEDVATPEAWMRNPALVLDFYNQRRRKLEQVEPNAGHIGLASLQEHFDVHIITQNVDDLHERAGSKSVLHLHGLLTQARGTQAGPGEQGNTIIDIGYRDIAIGDKCPRGSQLRPHIVWFGEDVPMIDPAIELAGRADLFAIIGTSLVVYPAASLIDHVPPGAPVYLIDPATTSGRPNVRHITTGASEGVRQLMTELVS
ncbi:NAD-dependent deacetylase [Ereboglobus sp. PH5-10]|uniref:SIR2 family NAD-dependent protein deacylase n=1 Tax=Ereboglobus sp. PH5-10 TaxID=2940629 RepID=UPI0024064AAB|nr:NAD-dependent deacylase [Ereboglobus sp. PH5-10]MDF9827750.1 NAD-dependent deacetylase [Ereboglobus sp. PH5-10]